jgi:DNA mismatch endonuclease (patch repair protein)
MMSGIRGKDTRPEIVVRKLLFAAGYRFRLHRKDLPGAPDIVLPSRKVAVFVNGCFWHMHAKCQYSKLPSTRLAFWQTKLEGNVTRDQKAINALLRSGWRVLTVWECVTRNAVTMEALQESLTRWIESGEYRGDLSGAKIL